MEENFYTLQGYNKNNVISPAVEDYIEMIYRCVLSDHFTRVNHLAALLHVKPSSSSKMIHRLNHIGLVESEPYGVIRLTDKGRELGAYLLSRHNILQRFFCVINDTSNELELVEKIEHFFDRRTIENIEKFMDCNIQWKNYESINFEK